MTPEFRRILLALAAVALLGLVVGRLMVRSAQDLAVANAEPAAVVERPPQVALDPPATRSQSRPKRRESIPSNPFQISNEAVVTFADSSELEAFLQMIANRPGIRLIGRIDALNSLRLGFGSPDDLAGLDVDFGENYTAFLPPLADGSIQPGAVGFGNRLLQFLGIEGRNVTWGEGVTVAVIDSGVADHPTFLNEITRIDLRADTSVPVDSLHGTPVGSLIAGAHPAAPGVAPETTLISIAVTTPGGTSDTFTLANAVVRAVDEGAQFINISMGTFGDSLVLQNAVNYAADNGVVIIAPTGNNGVDLVALPAGYESVVAVGAVDATSDLLDFSNTGESVDIVAPGLELHSASPGDRVTAFTGTSGSAPIVTGTMAAFASENPHLSPTQVAAAVLGNADDIGAPGADSSSGQGVVATDRVLNSTTPGVTDLAVTGASLSDAGAVLTTFTNRGSEDAFNVPVTLTFDGGPVQLTIPYLEAGATFTHSQLVDGTLIDREQGLTTRASIDSAPGDVRLDNNSRTTTIRNEP